MDKKTIDRNFKYHPPTSFQTDRYNEIRVTAKELALLFTEFCPESRELALALTKLEEAVMWANAAIARGGAVDD